MKTEQITDFIIDNTLKGIIVGSISSGITSYTYGKNVTAQFRGRPVNLALLTGIVIGLSSIASDTLTSLVFPHVTKDTVFDDPIVGLIQLASVSGGNVLLHRLADPRALPQRGLFNVIGMAMASEAIGSYVSNNYIEPIVRGVVGMPI